MPEEGPSAPSNPSLHGVPGIAWSRLGGGQRTDHGRASLVTSWARKKTTCSPGTLGELSTDSSGLKLFLGVAYFGKGSAHLQAKNAEEVSHWPWD